MHERRKAASWVRPKDWRVSRLSIVSGTHSLVLPIWEAMRTIVIQPLPLYVGRMGLEALDRLGFESGNSFESLSVRSRLSIISEPVERIRNDNECEFAFCAAAGNCPFLKGGGCFENVSPLRT